MDWAAIRNEYIASNLSQRALAKKHGVSYVTLSKYSVREGWVALRSQRESKETARVIEKAAEKASDVTTKIYTRAEEVLDKLGELTKNIVELSDAKLAADTLRSLKSALDVKSEADIREQEARIEKLRKEAQTEEQTREVRVKIEGAGDGWES